jgi:hypothetical protein
MHSKIITPLIRPVDKEPLRPAFMKNGLIKRAMTTTGRIKIATHLKLTYS